ncbi:MAG: peptidase [Devosia sp.]|nr:peptidase [Devosia sp.]
MNIFARFAKDESGATAIEYGLIAALISVAIITAITLLGGNLGTLFTGIAGRLNVTERREEQLAALPLSFTGSKRLLHHPLTTPRHARAWRSLYRWWSSHLSTIALLFFPFAMAFAASSDLLTMRISNKLVLLLVAGFALMALAIDLPLELVAMHIACALAVLVVGFAFFALGWIGGGDAKLAAATTLWLGFGLALPYLVYAALLGGVLTLGILALRQLPLTPLLARFVWLERLHDRKSGVPYGVALAIAGLLVYSNSAIFERLAA